MAAFPFTAHGVDSTEAVFDGIELDRASNGAARGRVFYTAKKRRFRIVRRALSTTDKATLETFYDNNRALAVDLIWKDGVVYSCLMTEIEFAPVGVNRWDAEVRMEQV